MRGAGGRSAAKATGLRGWRAEGRPLAADCNEPPVPWYSGVVEDEKTLVLRVQRGDLEAFGDLLDREASGLRAFVAMKLPIPHLIDEIAHETFVFAHRHIDQFEAGTDFGKWLRAIAYNLVRKEALKYQRTAKNKEKFLEHCLAQRAASGGYAPESPLIAHLEECLEKLPAQQRKLLRHKYTLSETSREMSRAFNQSESWVRTTLCRVRSALRDCIEQKLQAEAQAQLR